MAKVALLIGVSEYEPGLNPLPGAVKDVEAMRRVLAHPDMGGFAEADITVLKNPRRQEMEDAIYQLFANRQKDDLLLFYFSGHGVKDDSGKLYLSTRVTRKDKGKLVKPSAVAASFLHESINESHSQRQVVILDCCFSGAIAQGLTVKDDDTVDIQTQLGGKGRAILTSSTSTQYSFLKLRDEDVAPIEARFIPPKQIATPFPSVSDSESSQIPSTPVEKGKTEEAVVEIERAKGKQTFEFEVATLSIVKKLGWFGEKVTYEINCRRERAECFTENLGNDMTLEMVAIPGGRFLMGSPESEPGWLDSEIPQHTVTLQPFFLSQFPVTQAQWRIVAGLPKVKIDLNPDPSRFKDSSSSPYQGGARGGRPVENVSWHDAVEFCARLSRKTERQYRLPSEAEWEYAARSGTTTPFHFGETITPELANYNGNYTYASGPKGIYREQTTEVGSFPANAFGLYDMHGNVWEWCEDTWHENYQGAPTDGSAWLKNKNDRDSQYRLLRGGSWFNNPDYCRCACRLSIDPGDRPHYIIGFRVVCATAWTL